MQNLYIVPLEVSDSELIIRIVNELKKLFKTNVETVELNLDLSSCLSSDRNQYYSTKIISNLSATDGSTSISL